MNGGTVGGTVVISIHALRKESDRGRPVIQRGHRKISIHALRKESDASHVTPAAPSSDFNPRSP